MVYVDDMQAKFGRMVMCHMIADTRAELLAMVRKIGVKQKWIQKKDTYQEHFDISLARRELAIAHGACPITQRELVRKLEDRLRRARKDVAVVYRYRGE